MKIVVLGGTGQIGSKVTRLLRERGVDAVPASPSTGVDVMTGAGLDAVLAGADAAIDVSKPRGYDPAVVDAYFRTGIGNLLRAEHAAGVRHHVALAAVGTGPTTDIPFYRAKAVGTELVQAGGVPFSLVHATQFFEFADAIADSGTVDGDVVLPDVLVQPIAGDDVARVIVDIAVADPRNGEVDIAGPEVMPLAEFVGRGIAAHGDRRPVRVGADATYFGGRIGRTALLPGPDARILPTRLEDWLGREAR